MTRHQWTPGLWRVNPANLTEVIMGDDGYGADLYWTGDRSVAETNASLTAASKDLYKALEDLLSYQSEAPLTIRQGANVALAKARGEME